MRPSLITSSGSEVERFVAAAERFAIDIADADLGAPVPACPGWTTYDLAVHLGNVHAWAATIVETGRPAAEQNDTPGHRRPRTVSAWYAGKAEDLYEVLRATDPARPCWNFAYGDGQASFWARRQMHEATVHLMDLSAATGRDLAVDPELAADGVDEVLTVFGHRMHHRGFPATLTAPLCLVATDTGDAWTVTPRPVVPAPYAGVPTQVRGSTSESAPALTEGPPLVVPRRHPSADRVEATAETLYRLLWRRLEDPDHPDVTVTGDGMRVRAYLASRLVP